MDSGGRAGRKAFKSVSDHLSDGRNSDVRYTAFVSKKRDGYAASENLYQPAGAGSGTVGGGELSSCGSMYATLPDAKAMYFPIQDARDVKGVMGILLEERRPIQEFEYGLLIAMLNETGVKLQDAFLE